MYKPTLEEAGSIAGMGNYNVIPLSTEIYSDAVTPLEALRILRNVSGHCFLLESIEDPQNWGRYTYLGFEPTLELACADGRVRISAQSVIESEMNDPDEAVQKILDEHRSPRLDYLPPFTGGLMGYFSYDYIKYKEPVLKLDAKDEEKFNDLDLMLFDKIICFDNFRQKIVIMVNIGTENLQAEYQRGVTELQRIVGLIKSGAKNKPEISRIKSDFRALFSKDEFCAMVDTAKNYIKEGDIFQVVLSNRLEADFEGSLLDAYRVMRTTNPSPYMFYFGSSELEVAGASPETLVKLLDGRLFTFPLAGTRRRGNTAAEDAALEKELLADQKELAEHNMLVDLGRNDLGKISEFGTVKVEKYLQVEKFSHVMHIGSTVSGKISAGKNALSAIGAVLPAGTLSGAPKIRAMQIINELENNKRGIYGGAIGYIGFTGDMDTCIAIRMVFRKNGKVFIRSGAGIVADSIAESEYEECINKAKAVVEALRTSEGGIDQ